MFGGNVPGVLAASSERQGSIVGRLFTERNFRSSGRAVLRRRSKS